MKATRKIKRAQIDKTSSKPKGFNLNKVVQDTLKKMREGKFTKSILTKKTSQKNVFTIKFNTDKNFTTKALRTMILNLKQAGLIVLDASSNTSLAMKGNGEKSFVIFKVRLKPKSVDVGKRNRKTIKKVLAFIQEDNEDANH